MKVEFKTKEEQLEHFAKWRFKQVVRGQLRKLPRGEIDKQQYVSSIVDAKNRLVANIEELHMK